MTEVTYSDCLDVIASWSKVKLMKDYEDRLGNKVFTRFIDIEPESKGPLNIKQSDIDSKSTHYKYLAKTYFDMIDLSIDMLGPDLSILVGDLEDLGRRHGSFGVKPAFFHTLGLATFYGLKECRGEDFSKEELVAWKHVYEFLETNMVRGNKAYWEDKKQTERLQSKK